MPTTIGRILVNETLPDEYKDKFATLTKDDLDNLLANLVKHNPEKYREVAFKLMRLGANASFDEGITLNLAAAQLPIKDRDKWFTHIEEQKKKINASPGSEEEKEKAISDLYHMVYDHLVEETYAAATSSNNPFALQVKSKARGSKLQLAQLMTTPGIYQDANDKTIPVFIKHSYAEGLTPAEFWAATYGARKAVLSTKIQTALAGALGKQINNAAIGTVVTTDDCETPHGIPVNTLDDDNIGTVLAKDVEGVKAGTVLTRQILTSLNNRNIDNIVVRSPLTCMAPKGLCKQCVGIRETNKFSNIGDYIGITAASAVSERIAQSALRAKHQGGQKQKAGTVDNDDEFGNDFVGFDMISQFMHVPENFKNAATLSTIEGIIQKIEPAEQGGNYVYVNDEKHYVMPNLSIKVKPGDEVEAGDQLSSGIINPYDVVHYKGLGEGRRYFTERFTKLLRDSGYEVNRRNVEVITRPLLDHVEIDDDEGDFLPGEVTSYSSIAKSYKPRLDTITKKTKDALGMYLEQPALHYTIGTKVNKNVINTLNKFGHTTIAVNQKPVGFTPFMSSLRLTPSYEKDWVAQLGTSRLDANLLKNVHRGAESSTTGLNPIPAIAKGELLKPIKL